MKTNTLIYLIAVLICFKSNSQATPDGYLIFDDPILTEVDGQYLTETDYIDRIAVLNQPNFTLSYEFSVDEYLDQWPIVLGRNYRVMAIKLNSNKSMGLSLNNQREYFPLGETYELNKFYKVKIHYNRGSIKVYLNNKFLKEISAKINPKWPKNDTEISSCNYSLGKCFKGKIKNVKAFNNDPVGFLDWDVNYPYTDAEEIIKSELEYEKMIESDTSKGDFYYRMAKYRFIGEFTGNTRKVNNTELSSLKRVAGLNSIDPKLIEQLCQYDVEIKIGNSIKWMPIQSSVLEPFKEECKLNTPVLLYALFTNEHEYNGALHNNFLISDFSTVFNARSSSKK